MQTTFKGMPEHTAQKRLSLSVNVSQPPPDTYPVTKLSSEDLIPSPSEPVFTAQSQPALCAMAELVKQHGQ
ncbi:hypothetical protein PSTT_05784 [Puccinia striiformis]|nr:hypothetical protein PSTT_05784 [Puccinia striiformis]